MSGAPAPAWGSVPTSELASVDITSRDFAADPFVFWERLRVDAPVQRVRWARGSTAWVITRYHDVDAALRDTRLRKNRRDALTPEQLSADPRFPKALASLERGLLGLDGPDHDRLRRLVHQAFTPRRIEQMREQAERIAEGLLDTAQRRGSIDLVSDYAAPLPLIMITRIIGVPEKDVARFRAWTGALLAVADSPLHSIGSVLLFTRYLRRLVAARSRDPRDDLISALVAARDGGGRLTTDEIPDRDPGVAAPGAGAATCGPHGPGRLARRGDRARTRVPAGDPVTDPATDRHRVRAVVASLVLTTV